MNIKWRICIQKRKIREIDNITFLLEKKNILMNDIVIQLRWNFTLVPFETRSAMLSLFYSVYIVCVAISSKKD